MADRPGISNGPVQVGGCPLIGRVRCAFCRVARRKASRSGELPIVSEVRYVPFPQPVVSGVGRPCLGI